MKFIIRLMIIAITSTLLFASCSDDDDNNPNNNNNNNSDAPMSCTISGEYDIEFEASMVQYSSVPGDDEMIRTLTGYMTHEGKTHALIITFHDPNGNFKKDYIIDQDMSEGFITFLYDRGDGIAPESYYLNISGNINFATLTATNAIGTFNCQAQTLDGSKQITVKNGVINKK